MARPYAVDLRERVVRATAAKLEVSPSVVIQLRWRRRGTLAPDPMGGQKRSKLATHAERVHALLAAAPDMTIAGRHTRLAAEAIPVSPSAISRFLTACGLTRKQKSLTPPRILMGLK